MGTLLYLEIDKSAINFQLSDSGIDKFNFDILLRDKYPFVPPIIMTRTNFCTPTLADGRDMTFDIISSSIGAGMKDEWSP